MRGSLAVYPQSYIKRERRAEPAPWPLAVFVVCGLVGFLSPGPRFQPARVKMAADFRAFSKKFVAADVSVGLGLLDDPTSDTEVGTLRFIEFAQAPINSDHHPHRRHHPEDRPVRSSRSNGRQPALGGR